VKSRLDHLLNGVDRDLRFIVRDHVCAVLGINKLAPCRHSSQLLFLLVDFLICHQPLRRKPLRDLTLARNQHDERRIAQNMRMRLTSLIEFSELLAGELILFPQA
jgi:hypothetical protein